MGVYKRGKIYWLTFFHNGKRFSLSSKRAPDGPYTDRKLAEAWADGYKTDMRRQKMDDHKDCTLAEVLNRYIETHLTAKNAKTARDTRYLLPRFYQHFGAETLISEIGAMELDRYKTARLRTPSTHKPGKMISNSSVRRELIMILAAIAKAKAWGMISENPVDGYKLPQESSPRVRFIEDPEFYRLLNAAHPALAPVLVMARYTGMRQGEILGLQWPDVDLKRGFAHLRFTKSGESRMVPLSTEVVEMLSKTPLSARAGSVFSHQGKAMLRDGWLRDQFGKAVRLAGIADFRFHDLRHSFASHAAMRGVDVQTIANVLGHKTLRMTQRYSHLSSAHLKASVELAAPRKRLPTATKTLQSAADSDQDFSTIEQGAAKTPPFLAGLMFRKLVDPTGIEPATSSMPSQAIKPPESKENRTSRRKYDPHAN